MASKPKNSRPKAIPSMKTGRPIAYLSEKYFLWIDHCFIILQKGTRLHDLSEGIVTTLPLIKGLKSIAYLVFSGYPPLVPAGVVSSKPKS